MSKGEDMRKIYLQLKSSFGQHVTSNLREKVHWLKKRLKFKIIRYESSLYKYEKFLFSLEFWCNRYGKMNEPLARWICFWFNDVSILSLSSAGWVDENWPSTNIHLYFLNRPRMTFGAEDTPELGKFTVPLKVSVISPIRLWTSRKQKPDVSYFCVFSKQKRELIKGAQ